MRTKSTATRQKQRKQTNKREKGKNKYVNK